MEIQDAYKLINWGQLPNIKIISNYLNRSDLLEFSKLNKLYRIKLERLVFRNIDIIKYTTSLQNTRVSCLGYAKNYTYCNESYNRDLVLDLILLYQLVEDLGNKLKFTRSVTLNDSFNDQFVFYFVQLFANIKKLTFKSLSSRGNTTAMSSILLELEKLEHVEFVINMKDQLNYTNTYQVFPRSLKSIKIGINKYFPRFLPIFNSVDFHYYNLTALSIVTNIMLTNLTFTMPNLTDVEVLNYWDLDIVELNDFIRKNPQLIKLEIRFNYYNNQILETVLSSTCLKHLSIDKVYESNDQTLNLPHSYSIKSLKLSNFVTDKTALSLINACQIVEEVELTEWDLAYSGAIEWPKLCRTINYIKLINCHTNYWDIKIFDSLSFFNKASFKPRFNCEGIINVLEIDKLVNYSIITYESKNPIEFLLIKKTKQTSIN